MTKTVNTSFGDVCKYLSENTVVFKSKENPSVDNSPQWPGVSIRIKIKIFFNVGVVVTYPRDRQGVGTVGC